jgi:hypothetical protein
MATYIIIKNILENSVNFSDTTKIELTKKGGGMFMEIHGIIRNEYENGYFDRIYPVSEMNEYLNGNRKLTDRKKRKMASVMIFKNGVRMNMGFEYTLQNKKIDFKVVEVEPVNDSTCPHCGNDEIEFDGDQSFYNGEASQEVYCPTCDCHWHNVYKFKEVQIVN